MLVVFGEDLLELRLIARQKLRRAMYADTHGGDAGGAAVRQGLPLFAHTVPVYPVHTRHCRVVPFRPASSATQAVTGSQLGWLW